MSNAVNYTGLAPQLPQLQRVLPRTQAEWEQFLSQLNAMQQQLLALSTTQAAGYSGTIVTAKLSAANGSMGFTNGVLTASTPAT